MEVSRYWHVTLRGSGHFLVRKLLELFLGIDGLHVVATLRKGPAYPLTGNVEEETCSP